MKQSGVPSVTLQLVILFAAILALALILSVVVRYAEQRESLSVLESIRIAERVATIVSLMDSTPPAERGDLSNYFNSSTIRVAWDAESRIVAATEPADRAADPAGNALHPGLMVIQPAPRDTAGSAVPPRGRSDQPISSDS